MKHFKRFLPFLLVFALAGAAIAGGPYGGSVLSLSKETGKFGPLYCSTTRGMYRNAGGVWERIEGLGVFEITAFAREGDVIIAGGTRVVLRSTDGGATFAPSVSGLANRYGHPVKEVLSLVSDPGNRGVFYLGSAGKGFFESRDYGAHWKLLSAGLESRSPASGHVKAILPPRGDRPLIIGTDGDGLFAYRDNRWEILGNGLPKNLRAAALADDPGKPAHLLLASTFDGVFESVDSGANWVKVWKGTFGVASAVAISSEGVPAVFMAQEGVVVFKDGKAQPPVSYGFGVARDMVPDNSGGFYMAMLHDGVISLDGDGRQTGDLSQGLDATSIHSFYDEEVGTGVWAGDSNGVFYTEDNGKSWEKRDQGLLTGEVSAFLHLGGNLYVGTGGQGVFLWDRGKGEWLERGKSMGTANTVSSLAGSADGRIYAGTEGGVLVTVNGGVNWARANQGLGVSPRTSVAVDGKTPGTLYAATGEGLYTAEVGADSWTLVEKGEYTDVLFKSGKFWTFGPYTLYQVAPDGPKEVLRLEENTIRAVLPVRDGVWLGSDGGLHYFSEGETKLLWEGAGVNSLNIDRRGRLFAGTDGMGVKIFKIE